MAKKKGLKLGVGVIIIVIAFVNLIKHLAQSSVLSSAFSFKTFIATQPNSLISILIWTGVLLVTVVVLFKTK